MDKDLKLPREDYVRYSENKSMEVFIMNEVSKLLSDESVLIFADGTQIKGAKNVTRFIFRCCGVAIDGYISGSRTRILKGAVIGMVLAGGGITIYEVNRLIKNKKLKKQMEEAK